MNPPSRGMAFGSYPQRPTAETPAWLEAAWRTLRSRLSRPAAARLPRGVALAFAAARARSAGVDGGRGTGEGSEASNEAGGDAGGGSLARAIESVRARLRRRGERWGAGGAANGSVRGASSGEEEAALGEALGLAAAVMQRTLGLSPYDTQVLAAWLMLRGRLVEMATGEGKTLAAGLAAGVAGLSGAPVHVLTANDYLVQRDRETLAPFFTALGLTSACVTGATARDARANAWQRAIVYSTARELVFDYLRDHLALRGERDPRVLRAQALAADDASEPGAQGAARSGAGAGAAAAAPMLPGLCFCLVDEADSLLLDEAVVPLILAAPTRALDAAAYRRAYELSCTLQRQRDYALLPARRAAQLSDAGRERIAAAVKGAGGMLAPARRAHELVEAALAARVLFKRDREYLVAADKLLLIDELTGRVAEGRQWQGALQAMVEIKEGLEPSAPTATAAQITYQRFFPRYLRLGGMSGTLLEARHELRVAYDAAVKSVPLARPNRRAMNGELVFVDAAHKWQAVLHAVREHASAGRPVLVGTDSVAESAHLSALLQAAGITHQVLNALQDADEAQRVARAGIAGTVTVATNIAGRGTDIRLDAAAAARGGLHVIATMRNRSRRIDRQLIGRAARHGDPGSAQTLLALDDALLVKQWPAALLRALAAVVRPRQKSRGAPLATAGGEGGGAAGGDVGGAGGGRVPAWLARPLFDIAQRLAERRDQRARRELRHAERNAVEAYGFSGGTE